MTEIQGSIDPVKCPTTGNDCIYRKIVHQNYLNSLWVLERSEIHNSEGFSQLIRDKVEVQRELLLSGCIDPAEICGLALKAIVSRAE